MEGGLGMVAEGDEHVHVGHVQARHQQIAGQPDELVQGDLEAEVQGVS